FAVILRHVDTRIILAFNTDAPSHIHTLSLHDALPISKVNRYSAEIGETPTMPRTRPNVEINSPLTTFPLDSIAVRKMPITIRTRSEEHTSELQSRFDLVCRLLLEKKKYR